MDFHDPEHPLQQFLRQSELEMDAQIASERADRVARGYLPRHSFSYDAGGDTHPILNLGQFNSAKLNLPGKPATRYQEARSMSEKDSRGRTSYTILNGLFDNRYNVN